MEKEKKFNWDWMPTTIILAILCFATSSPLFGVGAVITFVFALVGHEPE